jgi:hypothetical protein
MITIFGRLGVICDCAGEQTAAAKPINVAKNSAHLDSATFIANPSWPLRRNPKWGVGAA